MATNCDACGHRTNEVKSGGGIETTGVKIEIQIKDFIDLKRDVLKVCIIFQYTWTGLNNIIFYFRAIPVISQCRSLN